MTYQNALIALADPTRRSVFEAVAQQPSSVASLAKSVPVSRPAVSQHLKVLQDAQLVSVTTAGRQRIYSLNTAGLEAIRTYLNQFWDDALGAYAAEVHRQTQT